MSERLTSLIFIGKFTICSYYDICPHLFKAGYCTVTMFLFTDYICLIPTVIKLLLELVFSTFLPLLFSHHWSRAEQSAVVDSRGFRRLPVPKTRRRRMRTVYSNDCRPNVFREINVHRWLMNTAAVRYRRRTRCSASRSALLLMLLWG